MRLSPTRQTLQRPSPGPGRLRCRWAALGPAVGMQGSPGPLARPAGGMPSLDCTVAPPVTRWHSPSPGPASWQPGTMTGTEQRKSMLVTVALSSVRPCRVSRGGSRRRRKADQRRLLITCRALA